MSRRELSCHQSLDHAPKGVSLRGHDRSWRQPRQPSDMPTNYSTKRSINRFPRAIHLPSRAILMRREGIFMNDGPVRTESLIRIDWLENRQTSLHHGCSATDFFCPCGFAAQAEFAA